MKLNLETHNKRVGCDLDKLYKGEISKHYKDELELNGYSLT